MSEEQVIEVYKIAKTILAKYEKNWNEDYLQDLVVHLVEISSKFDSSKGKITTYYYKCGYNFIKQRWRANSAQKRGYTISGEKIQEVIEMQPSKENLEYDLIKKETLKQIEHLIKPITLEYFKGAKQIDLAVKYNSTQETISRSITKNIEEIRVYCRRKGIELKL